MSFDMNAIANNLISSLVWVLIVSAAGCLYMFRGRLADIFLYKRKFRKYTGISSIDTSLNDGVSPSKSLDLCSNNIRFLGIAANKLINSDSFEDTIKRCNRVGEPIKFLLSSPDNPILKKMAKRANREENDFRNMIVSNLKRLQKLRDESGYNLQIKLYESDGESGPPSFRLFFVDNESVLVSYYVMGDGDGSQMPQLRIEKPHGNNGVKNFYYPFDHYFNSLWEDSEDFDPEKYV